MILLERKNILMLPSVKAGLRFSCMDLLRDHSSFFFICNNLISVYFFNLNLEEKILN